MRTQNTIRNILTTSIPFIIIGVLGFIKVKVFASELTNEIYSVNQLFFQIFSYLSLAEAGFGLFIIQKYYEMFSYKDFRKIAELNNFSIRFFRKIGFIMVVLSLAMTFFVHLFTKANIPLDYLRIIFVLFMVKNTIDYFMMAPRYVISADQKMYKINFLINFGRISEIIIEIILVYIGVDYLYVLLPGIVLRIITNYLINKKVYQEYEFLSIDVAKRNNFKLKGLSDIIIQRISGIFYSSTDIILISAFVNPLSVIVYSSYNFITKFIFDMSYVVGSSITPSFASALKDKKASLKVFNQMNIMFIFTSSFLMVCVYRLINNLIILWIGEKYLISDVGLLIMLAISFIDISSRSLQMAIESEGLFSNIKYSTIAEAILNLVISLLLVKGMGIEGVLAGSLIAKLLTNAWFMPCVVFNHVLNKNPSIYFRQIAISVSLVLAISYFLNLLNLETNNPAQFVLSSLIVGIIALSGLGTGFYVFSSSFRDLLVRLKYILNKKIYSND